MKRFPSFQTAATLVLLCLAVVSVSACEDLNRDRRARLFPERPLLPKTNQTNGQNNTQEKRSSTNSKTKSPTKLDGALSRAELYIAKDPLGRGQTKRFGKGQKFGDKFTGKDDVTLNFVDAPIAKVVEALLAQTLNLSYLIDPRIQGTVTVRTSGPIAADAVLPTLESALALRGAAIQYSQGIYRIVPIKEAMLKLGAPRLANLPGRSRPGFGLHVIPLRHASAAAMMEILRPYAGSNARLWHDPRRNFLLYAGTGAAVRDLLEMVALFDVHWLEGLSYGLFPLNATEPEVIIKELETIFTGGDKRNPSALQFVPIERLNAVLAIAQLPEDLAQARIWVQRLDRGNSKGKQQIFVYRVKHGRAVELAEILNQLLRRTDNNVRRASALPPGSRPVTVIRTAANSTQPATAANTATNSQKNKQAIVNQPVAINKTARQQSFSATLGKTSPLHLGQLTDQVQIIPDENNNALVIASTGEQYELLQQTLKLLDTIPLQVLVEVTIAEITLNDALKYGVEWFLTKGDVSTSFSALATGVVASRFPGFSLLFNQDGGERLAALHALTSLTNVNVVSSPQLLVLNNQTASLQVGDQIPITTQSSVSNTAANAATVNSVSYRDTGVLLEVTPRVNAGGNISIDILQEVSDVVTTSTSGIDSPTIQQRKMKSSISIQSGNTVVLGGLIRDSTSKAEVGIPLLSDIPILGNLFKTTSDTQVRTELLILITPRVIRNRSEALSVTEEIRKRFRALRPVKKKAKSQ